MMIDGFETETIVVDGVAVDGVLVSPAETDAGLVPTDITLPANADVRYRLDIPKTYTERLRGQKIEIRGELYDVADKPAYTDANTPGAWNRYALAYRLEGDYSSTIAVMQLVTTLDDLGDPLEEWTTIYEGEAQARMKDGDESGGTAIQTDATETWLFVVPWLAAFDSLRPQATVIEYKQARYDVTQITNVDNKSETASFEAVRRG